MSGMNPNEARLKTLSKQYENLKKQPHVQEALELITKAVNEGEMSVRMFDDDKIRRDLQRLGWAVSDMWQESRFYKTRFMTVSWDTPIFPMTEQVAEAIVGFRDRKGTDTRIAADILKIVHGEIEVYLNQNIDKLSPAPGFSDLNVYLRALLGAGK